MQSRAGWADMKLAMAAASAGLAVALAAAVQKYLEARRELLRECERKEQLAVALLATRNRVMHAEDSTRIGRSFSPKRDDVFVVTYPKCGTTWVTQIVHSLRGGTMDFDDINEVAPWDTIGRRPEGVHMARDASRRGRTEWQATLRAVRATSSLHLTRRAQANARGSSGVRGVAQTRNAGRGVGRAPRQACQVDSMRSSECGG